ncbi:ATP-binding cassette domain-containing protein [Actinokineospora diospyrosa]|uniref:ABC-2 type transport system ATP-binding protein n=1 Tax=Actinokineospora diospyrosa TaxID=103728 RepID=A0ABT1I9T5_9PSEU|nr:ATP-binding cassette domain-containing protein [Actinokineospora diospyrosa]MCP2269396.1 ABC-2 type transport system ATP-binding protein [Actinokineospora diospyrosa]
MIIAEKLVKTYGEVRAVDGLDLLVPQGTVFGLLGPNGAGKTTSVRMLASLCAPDSGRAVVAGIDVVRKPREVRKVMGLAGQYSAVDDNLTGRQNLDMIGRLHHLGAAAARTRAEELLRRFDLVDAADRQARGYSGGMRRRLDLAGALVGRPRVLFLDEPTTGLDPRSRQQLWDVVQDLADTGTTVLLTTQYLEEADRLAAEIAVVDGGRIIAQGSPERLKADVGGGRLEVTLREQAHLAVAIEVLGSLAGVRPRPHPELTRVDVPTDDGELLVAAVRALDAAGVRVVDIALRRPTLDDVFLALTGRAAERGAA